MLATRGAGPLRGCPAPHSRTPRAVDPDPLRGRPRPHCPQQLRPWLSASHGFSPRLPNGPSIVDYRGSKSITSVVAQRRKNRKGAHRPPPNLNLNPNLTLVLWRPCRPFFV